MKRKKIFVIGLSIMAFLLVMLIILPIIFKDKIIEAVKTEINKNLNAEVNWESIDLGLIRSFPDFSLEINKLSVKGIEDFENDTLISSDKFGVKINLFSVFGSDGYEIKSIYVNSPRVNAIVLKNGKTNWDIMKESEEAEDDEEIEDGESSFKLKLKKFTIRNGYVKYQDDEAKMLAEIVNLNHALKGDLSASITKIRTKTNAEQLSFSYENVPYLVRNSFESKFDLNANLDNWRFDLLENYIKLNQLTLNFDGFLQLNDDDMDMDLNFSTPSTDFKHILSMIPAIYEKEFESIDATGNFELSGFAKGKYTDNSLPAFALNMKVKNAQFKYPDLPKPIDNINIDANISNKGGSEDNTVINVNPFSFTMAGNPFKIKLLVSTPISNPNIDFEADGKLDMEVVKDFYPLEDNTQLKGLLTADILFKGTYDMIEKEQYDKFDADGSLVIDDFFYSDNSLPQGVSIPKLHLTVNPRNADLKQMDAKFLQSDMSMNGKIDNIMSYLFGKEVLRAKFNVNSNYFNANEFLGAIPESDEEETTIEEESATLEAFDIPANIDFALNVDFKKIHYDNLELTNAKGAVKLKDKKAELSNLNFNIFEGLMTLNGYYSAKEVLPQIAFGASIKDLDIYNTWKAFDFVKKFAPIAEYAKGKFTAGLDIDMVLDKNLNPKLETLNSKGNLSTKSVGIVGSEMMSKIAKATKIDEFRAMSLKNLALKYQIKDGRLETQPFTIAFSNVKATVSGFSRLDQSLDYLLQMEVPRKAFGNATNDFVDGLTGKISQKGVNVNLNEIIKFDVQIIGTFTNPVIKTGLKDKAQNLLDDAKDGLKQEVEAKKEEVVKTVKEEASKAVAEAKKKADAIMADARRAADAAKNEAKKAGDKLVAEAETQGQKLIAEAKNPVAKIAAEKSAEKLVKEAKASADKLNREAEQKSDKILNDAQAKADKLIQEAEEKTK